MQTSQKKRKKYLVSSPLQCNFNGKRSHLREVYKYVRSETWTGKNEVLVYFGSYVNCARTKGAACFGIHIHHPLNEWNTEIVSILCQRLAAFVCVLLFSLLLQRAGGRYCKYSLSLSRFTKHFGRRHPALFRAYRSIIQACIQKSFSTKKKVCTARRSASPSFYAQVRAPPVI